MKKILFCFCVLVSYASIAQTKTIKLVTEDGYGWMYDYQFENGPKTMNGFTFSARQLDICHSLVKWMKASYVPQNFLGDAKRYTNVGLKNTDGKLLPIISYGATVYTWNVEMKNGKPAPIQETESPWGITVNEKFGGGLGNINVGDDYYFILPDYDFFDKNISQEVLNKYDIKRLPQFKNFYPSYNGVYRYLREPTTLSTLLLCKDNHLPIVTVTYKELLEKAKQMIDREHQKKLKLIPEQNKDNQKRIDIFIDYEAKNYQKAIEIFGKHIDKYKNRMSEPAEIQGSFDYIDFVNGYDIFTRKQINEGSSDHKTFTIYKFEPGVLEQTKQGIPLWIRVSWAWHLGNEKTQPLHESIINNFDFQYLYDYVFNPDKVKGKPYKPLRSPTFKEAVVVTEASETTKKNTPDKNVFFFEDFSTTAIGKKPIGWQTQLSTLGSTALVTNLNESVGNWVELRGHYIKASLIKKTLPQNFTFTYDIAVPQNFTWGAKGLTMLLSKETSSGDTESFISLKLRPGFGGRDGEATLETKFPFPPGYSNGTKWYVANGFSNNKKFNRISVTIKKSEEKLQVFIDKTKIAEYEKAIPLAHPFNALSFYCGGNSAENDKYFISNIKITKE